MSDRKLQEAMTCYHCKPLVEEIDRLKAELAKAEKTTIHSIDDDEAIAAAFEILPEDWFEPDGASGFKSDRNAGKRAGIVWALKYLVANYPDNMGAMFNTIIRQSKEIKELQAKPVDSELVKDLKIVKQRIEDSEVTPLNVVHPAVIDRAITALQSKPVVPVYKDIEKALRSRAKSARQKSAEYSQQRLTSQMAVAQMSADNFEEAADLVRDLMKDSYIADGEPVWCVVDSRGQLHGVLFDIEGNATTYAEHLANLKTDYAQQCKPYKAIRYIPIKGDSPTKP